MERNYARGVFAKPPHEKAPDFVKANVSLKRKQLIEWLEESNEDWINLQILESKDKEKWYVVVDTYKKKDEDPFA